MKDKGEGFGGGGRGAHSGCRRRLRLHGFLRQGVRFFRRRRAGVARFGCE